MTSPVRTQTAYRFVEDDGSLTGATLLGTGNNQSLTRQTGTLNKVRVRLLIEESNNKSLNNILYTAYIDINDAEAWTEELTTTSQYLRLVDDDNSIADNATTAQRIGSGTYTTGDSEGYNDGTVDQTTGHIDNDGNDEFEIELCVYIVDADVNDGDTIDIRIYESGAPDVALEGGWTNEARLVVSKPAPTPINRELDRIEKRRDFYPLLAR